MSYQFVSDQASPHLGGNIAEGDPLTFAPTVWRYVIDRFAVRSVLDLGSGLGYAANYFFRMGVATIAVDGLAGNVRKSIYPAIEIDLAREPVRCAVDLVHCQEVVEHVAEEHVNNVLASLACGRFIVMSHAEPGQGGFHHVNLQPAGYWIAGMARFGFHLLPEDTARVKRFAEKDGAYHLARSGLVFAAGVAP